MVGVGWARSYAWQAVSSNQPQSAAISRNQPQSAYAWQAVSSESVGRASVAARRTHASRKSTKVRLRMRASDAMHTRLAPRTRLHRKMSFAGSDEI